MELLKRAWGLARRHPLLAGPILLGGGAVVLAAWFTRTLAENALFGLADGWKERVLRDNPGVVAVLSAAFDWVLRHPRYVVFFVPVVGILAILVVAMARETAERRKKEAERPRLRFTMIPGVPPFRVEKHLAGESKTFGMPVYDVFHAFGLYNYGDIPADVTAVQLELCLPEDGNDHGAFATQQLPLPLAERLDDPGPAKPYRIRFTIRPNHESHFRVVRRRTTDGRCLYLCFAQHGAETALRIRDRFMLHSLLVRAYTSKGTIFDQWLTLRLGGGSDVDLQMIPAPELGGLTPALMDELEELVSQVNETRAWALHQPGEYLARFSDSVEKLALATQNRQSRLDAFTKSILQSCVTTAWAANGQLAERQRLVSEGKDPGYPEQDLMRNLADIRAYREGLTRWFTAARRLVAERDR